MEQIAKGQGQFKGGTKKQHAGATSKDKVIYDRIVQLLKSGMSVMDTQREVGMARNTIYGIKNDLNFVSNDEQYAEIGFRFVVDRFSVKYVGIY